MFHLEPGSDFRTDLSAVMLADGKWYSVYDPTLPNGGEYLSFLQYPDGRDQRAVMVNVSLTDIKAVAYFGVPTTAWPEDAAPSRPPVRPFDWKAAMGSAGRIMALPDDDFFAATYETVGSVDASEVSDRDRGLYPKYRVEKVNGKPMGEYFVLEQHDPLAVAALWTYALQAADTYPVLAEDLERMVKRWGE